MWELGTSQRRRTRWRSISRISKLREWRCVFSNNFFVTLYRMAYFCMWWGKGKQCSDRLTYYKYGLCSGDETGAVYLYMFVDIRGNEGIGLNFTQLEGMKVRLTYYFCIGILWLIVNFLYHMGAIRALLPIVLDWCFV